MRNNIHIVEKGETLWTIAKAHCLTLDELLEANPQITNPNLILAGQEISIPISPTPCPPIIEDNNQANNEAEIAPIPGNRPMIYVVKPGDTMYRIAKGFNMDLKDLLKVNPHIKNPDIINVGDKLFIPKPKRMWNNIPMPNIGFTKKENCHICPYEGDADICPWMHNTKEIVCPHCGRGIK